MTAKYTPPAAVRNAPHLIEVLGGVLPARGVVLEIASGSGYHAAAFAQAFTHLTWQPSDQDEAARGSIAAYAADSGLANLLAPLALNVMEPWPIAEAAAIVCINMIHISPWTATLALFAGAANILPAGAPLITYGPYILHGDFLAQSNIDFDQSLKDRNPAWGLREIDDLSAVAATSGLVLEKTISMPANNHTLVWRRVG